MNVPVLDLRRQYESIRSEIDDAISGVLESGEFILGEAVQRFEKEAAAACGARHAIGLASGTDALFLSLKALGVGPGDAVLVPSFTFFATAGVVHNVGATPVFCDIDPETYNIDPESARRAIKARSLWPVARRNRRRSCEAVGFPHKLRATRDKPGLRAILPVHLYGQMAAMDEILSLADEFGLAVIEDAAQAIGARYERRVACGTSPVGGAGEHGGHVARGTWPVETADAPAEGGALSPGAAGADIAVVVSPQATGYRLQTVLAGSLGALGCFSFYPTKNLGAYGDAGMVTTNDDALAETIRLLRVHGAKPKYVHHVVGINSRLDAIQAAILSAKLTHLAEWTEARRRVANRYDALLAGVPGIVLPYRAPGRTHIFHQYTIRVLGGRRDALASHLKAAGVGTMVYYPGPLHLQECFAHLGYREGDFPESERASREVLSLPIFPELRDEEQEYVAGEIRRFGERGS